MPEKKITCDCCGEEWEESFFCKKCSHKFIGTKWEETPKVMWDGSGNDMEWEEVDQFTGDVCGNCCRCHLRGDGE